MTGSDVETGVEKNSDIESDTRVADHDWFGYADDGEHATVWGVDRMADDTVEVTYYRCEAGLVERGPNGTEQFDIADDKATEDFAREVANADPELAIEGAREHYDA